MKSSIFTIAFSMVFLSWNSVVQAQTATAANLKPIKTLECMKSPGTLQKNEEYDFMSDGWCQDKCGGQLNSSVMAITAGSICYCGNTLPALDQTVNKSFCNSPCNGFNLTTCGGFGYWQIYLTGLTNDVKRAPNSTASSSSGTTAAVTQVAETVVVTNTASPSTASSNKVGIAVGVVVGLVALSGAGGAMFLFFSYRKRKAIEEEHRRMEAQVAALAAEKSDTASTHTDSRLDSSNIFSHRRESVGSIADEMDFSRRILQVRNPDRFSSAPPAV